MKTKRDLEPLLALLSSTVAPLEALEQQIRSSSERMIETYDSGPEDGVSYLDVKQQLLGHYNLALLLYCRLKLSVEDHEEHKSLCHHPLLREMFRLRSLLEKLRPLDKKLRFQIDRLLRVEASEVATAVEANGTDEVDVEQLHFRPRPELLAPHGEEMVPEESEDADVANKIYQAPRLAPVAYEEELSAADKKAQKAAEKARRRLKESEMMQSLREELGDDPELVDANLFSGEQLGGVASNRALRMRKEDLERQRWEEERFVRSSISKKEKLQRKRMRRAVSAADSLADFTVNADALSKHFAEVDRKSRAETIGQGRGAKKSSKRPSKGTLGAFEEAIDALAKDGAAYDPKASNKRRRKGPMGKRGGGA